MMKRVLALVLVLAMVLGCAPAAFAAVPLTDNSYVAEQNELAQTPGVVQNEAEQEKTSEEPGLTKFESSGWERFSDTAAMNRPEADDVVTFIVVVDEKPQLELFSVSEIANQTASVQTHAQKQENVLTALKNRVKASFGNEDGFELGFTYTVATTGFSVTTAYGNKEALESMENVKKVYVAATFNLPEEQDFEQYTNNATTMIGAHTANETGYTGKGMRVAILDTGIKVDHPSFAALPESALVDPMTRESVNEIWKDLNAGQMTTLLNTSYYNSKLPFVFNYDAGSFDVANIYAGSDHGTHVAGITAANKTEGTNAIGVAPDAQLVVMQVFQRGGGASWATIMAALEDCVRLEVDAANLSLGSAAGFVDPEDEMLETLNLFLDTDIQVLIAAGNDTHNAYMNAWGLDMSLIENPDIGLIGTPASYSAALAVASMDNNGYEMMSFVVGGRELGFQDTAVSSFTSFIQNFRNEELEYVVVPGFGTADDYEGLDVEGKVALVSRGDISFPEKQAIAQEKGAIALIVYNNVLGFFGMQINDGEGNIPAVSIAKAAGEYMITEASAEGLGVLTVGNGDIQMFQLDTTLSDFSSWGVAPDLTLKPEISGVGGSIYATRDPAIAGSNYGYMSGTSMACPQVAGAMAVLIQYLDENYPELTGAEQRRVAAALAMSTANPILSANGLEYSPRGQGAGLVDLVKATTTPAYLSNPNASEGRAKVEFGDDPAKTGVYTFTFTVNNLSGEAQTYEISSSVLTESIYGGYFIANAPYALEAEVAVDGPVTVPAYGTVTVNATITLTENDKAYLNQFPNGIYVEGYVYATPVTGDEGETGVTLSMPMLGFYGDWSDAPVFDAQDTENYSLHPAVVYTYYSQLGYNPYFRSGNSGEKYNAVSNANPIDEIDFGMLRNAKRLDIKVTDKVTGEEYHYLEGTYMPKTYFNASYGMIIPTMIMGSYGETWDGKTADGKSLPDGTKVTYSFEAWLDDGDDIMDDRWSFDMVLDNLAPEVLNEDSLQESLRFEGERTFLSLEMQDSHYIAALIFQSPDGAVMGKYEIDAEPGEVVSGEYEITGFGSEFTIVVADYACNENEIDVLLDLGDQNNAVPQPAKLDKGRLYGSETFDGAIIEPGWFSADKADFSDPRNETFNSANRYYAAEFVNGYLIGQSTATGHLELITPSGSYWSSKVLLQNNGSIGDPDVWNLYDMALDHSGTLLESYGITGNDGTDGLFAVGWMYKGDTNNDGHDDGYNALFAITFSNGYVNVREVGHLAGIEGGDLLTLGITTEGEIYGIDTNAVLYKLDKTRNWDDNVGQYGDYVVNCNVIGETSFVDYPNYAGANVIQSMGYDHNTGTMYWYAHTQVPVSYYHENVNITYSVDLETGECTEIGTYGPGGLTCLFVPNDLESDLFTMGVEATNMAINPSSSYMLEGQTQRLKIDWTPWNASPIDVTWASLNEDIATVDEYGYVTAVKAGVATITASAEMMLDGYWDVVDGEWIWRDPAPGVKTVQATITVVPSEDALYGYAMEDNGNPGNSFSWITYSDKDLYDVTVIGESLLPGVDADGNEVMTEAMWAGGTYYNGYLWTTTSASWQEEDVIYMGTQLYKSKVTKGATPAETVIGEPELVGVIPDMEITALGFDYNTGRMYCVENKYVGGLGILDLETAEVDMLGLPNGDLAGATYIPALCVTGDGTIVISDAVANLYTIDPDTLTTKCIYTGNGVATSAFYEAMTYDHETGAIYWNMCDGNYASPLYLVLLPEYEYEQATVVDLGGVSSKVHVQQTVLFTLPEVEPETNMLPVESIEITNGEALVGLQGGSLKLSTVTVPARPTIQKRTWTSSDESVVTVDATGTVTYVGLGTATITVSITNKDEATYGGPFTDSIEITVKEAAGKFVAFLNADEGGSQYYDFWLNGNDYDLRHTTVGQSMIAIYSLRTGTYYDGYFYGYNDKGEFMRIDSQNPANYKVLGKANLDYTNYQVTAMAMDYTSGTMYALTLPSNYNFQTWASEEVPGYLVTVNLDNGQMTAVATLDFATPVFALACDAEGQLYAAGGSFDVYADSTTIYKLDKATGELTEYVVVEGAGVFTGANYYGSVQYNSQMTYDWGTNRLYLNATVDDQYYYTSHGMFMVELGDEPVASYLDGISLDFGYGRNIKYGEVYLGLLAFIPEADEIPVAPVNGIMLNTNSVRMAVGTTAQMVAEVRPSNAADKSLTWTSADETVATVDSNGLIVGVAEGKTTVTVTSNETGITSVINVTVVDPGVVQSIAYTASAQKDALITFDPNLPSQTAEVVATISGGGNIKGIVAGENCLYYVINDSNAYYLYRFDLTTKQSALMGQLDLWFEPTGMAYDAENGLFYITAGFYLFMFQEANLDPNSFNMNANYVMDSDYCTLTGVTVIDGAVYTFGNDYYSSAPKMMRYSDMYLSDRTVLLEGFDMTFVAGATDIAYDALTERFYMTDAGHNIFAMDMEGNVEEIGLLGNGLDLNGLGIYAPTLEGMEFTVTLDADGGEVESETITAVYGEALSNLPVPTKKYHNFLGWFDAEGNEYTAETVYQVVGDLTLTAKWEEIPVVFTSISTTLSGNIGLNFYVRLSDEIVNDAETVMQFTYAGRVVTVPMADAVIAASGDNVYRFTCTLTSKNMADLVTAQVVTSEGNVGASKSMDIATYCNWVIANIDDAETVNLMKAMLNYGASAQVLFNHNTDNLANATLAEADKVLADVDASAFAHVKTGEEEGIEIHSVSLLLDSETVLRVYYQLTGDKTIDEYTFYLDGEEVTPIQKGDRYYIEIRNIGAHKLDDVHEFTVGGLSMTYSVLSYVNTVLNVSADEAVINMAKALYAYSMAAEAYLK